MVCIFTYLVFFLVLLFLFSDFFFFSILDGFVLLYHVGLDPGLLLLFWKMKMNHFC